MAIQPTPHNLDPTLDQTPKETPPESGVSAFTGEEEYVAWSSPAMIRALVAAGADKWNPSVSPKLTGDLVEPTRPVEAKPPVDEKPVAAAIDAAGVLRSVDDVAHGEDETKSVADILRRVDEGHPPAEPTVPVDEADVLRRVDTEYSPLRSDDPDAEPLTRSSDLTDEEIRIRADEGATLIKNSDLSMYDDSLSHLINF